MKPEMKEMNPELYEKFINKAQLSRSVYGCGERNNKSGQRETVRDPDSEISIFDDACFMFYVIKYCEILGFESLIALL